MPDIGRDQRSTGWEEQLRKGGLELAVLLALTSEKRYGLEILRVLQEQTDLAVNDGTIYPILSRLARQGLLEAEWVQESAHPRKYYRLTRSGRARVKDMIRTWSRFTSKINALIGAAGLTHDTE